MERTREKFSTRDRISNPHAFKNPMVLLGQCGIVENFVYFDRAVEKIRPSKRPILNSNCNFCLLTHELFSYAKHRGFRCGKLCGKLWKPCGKLCGKVGVVDFSTGFSTEFSTIPQRGFRGTLLLADTPAGCVRRWCAMRIALPVGGRFRVGGHGSRRR